MSSEAAEVDSVPKVSVLLPNLNNRRFLEERFQTILAQTLDDWELIVVDNFSDDGAWELIQEYSIRDNRIRISQAPRQGMYANWNNCIELARGEYVYIATSDDTMTPDCLQRMVWALDTYPECDLCHCCLRIIDESGDPVHGSWENHPAQRFYGDLTRKCHIRKAPLDGVLHFGLHIIYSSITQLLIRRSVFGRVGLFRGDWGSCGDFEWEMRTSLVCSTFHLPEYLATWRVHEGQATQKPRPPEHLQVLLEMTSQAIEILREHDNDLFNEVNARLFKRIRHTQELLRAFQYYRTGSERTCASLRYAIQRPMVFAMWLWSGVSRRLFHRGILFQDLVVEMRRMVALLDLCDNVRPVDDDGRSHHAA